MILDVPGALRNAVEVELVKRGDAPVADVELAPSVRWRPHLFQPHTKRAWHLLSALPDSDRWVRRISSAVEQLPEIQIGLAAAAAVAQRPEFIRLADQLFAEVIVLEEMPSKYCVSRRAPTIIDLIYSERWLLEPPLARDLLDRCFARALTSLDSYAKGALLELTIALLMSQIDGWEVTELNVSTANQEIDVWGVNRNVAGPLAGSQFVLAEGKNWKANVPRKEYDAFLKKLRTRRGRASLGLMVAANDFEAGTYVEHIRDSTGDELVLLLNGKRFPAIWRDFKHVTAGMEAAVVEASSDYLRA